MDACLNAPGYDPQCEGDRGLWLLKMADLTGDPSFYIEAVKAAFPEETESWTLSQQAAMMVEFARRGDESARQMLYERFNRREWRDCGWFGGDIVALDGVAGLLHIAATVGRELRADPEEEEDNLFLNISCQDIGIDAAIEALETAAQDNADIRAYVDSVIATSGSLRREEYRHDSPRPPLEPLPIEEFLATLDGDIKSIRRWYPSHFARRMSPDEALKIVTLIEGETDPERLLRYLWVFRMTPIPRLTERLFVLAEGDDERLGEAAFDVMGQRQDPKIREFALRLLVEGKLTATGALLANYQPGDFAQILPHLQSEDLGRLHSVTSDLLKIADSSGDLELLHWIYETNPCAFCRGSAVRDLAEKGKLTAEMIAEAQYDAFDETRELILAQIQS